MPKNLSPDGAGLPAASPLLRLAGGFMRRPAPGLVALSIPTLFFCLLIPRLELRTDGAALYPVGDATIVRDEADRALFREPEQVVVLVTSTAGGPPLASIEGLRYLDRIQKMLQDLPAARSDGVRSIVDLLAPPPGIRPYLKTLPETPEELAALLDRLRRHPLAGGLFLSADGAAAAFYVQLAESASFEELIGGLRAVIEGERASPFSLRLTGPAIAEAALGDSVLRDLAWLTPLMVLAIAGLLFLSLGSAGGVLVPLIEVLGVLVWTLGTMALFGVPVTLVTTILPVVLMAMAVLDEVHLLERFQGRMAAEEAASAPAAPDRAGLANALLGALGDLERPIVLTSVTTAIGFLSFLTASIVPMRHFGLFAALGILLAMALTFTLVPALIMSLPPSWFLARRRTSPSSGRWRGRLERLLTGRGDLAFAAGLGLVALSLPGLLRLEIQDAWIDNFDPRAPLVTAARELDAKFWGSYRFDVVLTSDQPGFFHRPQGVALAEEVVRVARQGPDVRGVVSYLVPFHILAEAWEEASDVLSRLPEDRISAMAAWVGIVKYRIDQLQFVTEDERAARVRIFIDRPDYRRGKALREYLSAHLPAVTGAAGVRFHLSGELPVAVAVVDAIVSNQLRSIGWTAAGVWLLLAVAFRDLRRASALMAPVLAAACLVVGAMGYLGTPLGIATSMFTALTIGVGVDFAQHFSHRYWRQRSRTRDHRKAVRESLRTSGKALLWSATVLCLGFLVLAFSALAPNRDLGLLLAAAMLASYGTTLLLLPALLQRLRRPKSAAED